jgi:RNA polymerase sigma-70 factor (ECF subfamily)
MEQAYTSYNPDNDPVIRKLYSEELGFILNDAIETLPKRCREVFILSHIEGISNKRIAEILGISLSTVENHIYNALKSLRNKLK